MDPYWQQLSDQAKTARQVILVANLSILIPLSIIEIAFIQKFRVDKLFFLTCTLYTACFSLRLIYYECFSNAQDLSYFSAKFLTPTILILQSTACLCLTYYILIIEFVKITIESMSPFILNRDTKRHRMFTWLILGFLFSILIAQAILDQEGYDEASSALGLIYVGIVLSLCFRFIWIVKFFVNKKSSKKANNRSVRSKIVWVWIIVFLNIAA